MSGIYRIACQCADAPWACQNDRKAKDQTEMTEKSRFPPAEELEADLHPNRDEGELRRSESRLAAILAIAADAIISLDDEMRITLFNDGAERLFGYTWVSQSIRSSLSAIDRVIGNTCATFPLRRMQRSEWQSAR